MRILFLSIAGVLISFCLTTKLVLVRIGESEFSKLNLFTGWTDVHLSEKGFEEANKCGKLLKENGYKFDICYTSFLKRAIQTSYSILNELDQLHIPVVKEFRLNERHFGVLQGLNKKESAQKYGKDQISIWKRSFEIPPPPLHEKDERNPRNQEKYKNIQKNYLPLHESLKDMFDRVILFYNNVIIPDIKDGKNVIIVAHDHSIRALVKYLDNNISENDLMNLNIQPGFPIIFEMDKNLKPIEHYYLGIQETIFPQIKNIKDKDSNSDLNIIMVDKLNEEQKLGVWELIKSSDKDFIPPLSSRSDTTHKFLSNKSLDKEKSNENLEKFYEELIKESFLLLIEDGKVEGFFSIIKDYNLELENEVVVCDYITIIIINSKNRNKGYTKKMYNVLLNERKNKIIATRTWSLNYSHMHILDSLGFKLVHTDKDDRGINIHTVYYLKNPIYSDN